MVSIRIFSIVFIVFSLTVNVKSQTCESTSQYGLCSSNSACGCFPITFTDNIGICGLISVNCSRLSPCQPGDTCQNADHICVLHPRCSSTPLCYPLSMIDQRLCPPMTRTTTKATTPSFVTTEGTTAEIETTDYDSNYFTTDSFIPSDSIMSNYSNELTTNNEKNPNTNKYYQAIEILVNTSGYYDIRSLSNIDTYGCLYRGNYNPLDSSNQIICNDDYINTQFRFLNFLEAGVSYTLLFTTYRQGITGSYSVVAYGPDKVKFNPVGTFSTTMTTPIDFTSNYPDEFTSNYPDEFTSNYPDGFISKYSGALTLNSGMFSRTGRFGSNYYYEAIQINVNTPGTYTFISQGSTSESNMDYTTDTYIFTSESYMYQGNMDTYGYIYQGNFYPNNPTMNLIQQDDDNGGNGQFRLTGSFQSDITYVLVFTTYSEGITGPFSIVASGPDNVIFNPINNIANK